MPNIHSSPLAGVGEAFMQRAALKQQAKRDDYNAKVQAAQLEIQRQELARRAQEDQRQAAQDAAVAKSRAIQDEANTFNVQQAKDQAARDAQARAQRKSMIPAELSAHEEVSGQLVDVAPELEGEVKALWQIALKLPDQESQVTFLNERLPLLGEQAKELINQKRTAQAVADRRRGFYAGANGDPDEMVDGTLDSLDQEFQQGKITAAQHEQGYQAVQTQLIKTQAEVETRAAQSQLLEAQAMQIPPSDPRYEQARMIVGSFNRKAGGGSYDDANAALQQVLNPQRGRGGQASDPQSAQLEIFQKLPAVDDAGNAIPVAQRIAEAKQIYQAFSQGGEAQGQAGGSGGQQEAEARIAELVASGVPHAQAVAQARQEFSGEQAPEVDPGMKAPTSTATKHLTKPLDTMDKAGLEAFKKQVDELEGKRKLKAKGSANKRGDGLKNR